MRTTRYTLGLFGVACIFALGLRTASAAEPFGVEAPLTVPPAPAGTEQAVVARYWELGRVRPFLAASLETGFAYVRPRFAAGYGRPFWSWIGAETYPLLSLSGFGHYAGLAGGIPGLTARAGARYYYPFSRSFLEPRDSFSRADTDVRRGPRGDYLAFEGELTGTIPLFSGSAFAVLTGYRTTLVPDDYYLFEESLRVVVKPPYVWRARLGYLLALSSNGAIRVGVTGEVIGVPGRNEFIVRGGVLASVLIDAHLEAQASFIPVLASPDNLGLAGGDFGQLGLRFRWATSSNLRHLRPVTPTPPPTEP